MRFKTHPRLTFLFKLFDVSFEPGASLNWIETPDGETTQAVYRLRLDYAFTPRMFFSSLLQYNEAADILSSNLRFRWEYLPGSALFLVWSSGRDYFSRDGDFDVNGTMGDLFRQDGENVFMVKLSYWLG